MRLVQVSSHSQSALDLIQYWGSLYGYALTLTRNGSQAEDLVQETYLRALRAIGRLRPDGNAKRWLFTILLNIWRNQLRQATASGRFIVLGANEKKNDLHSDYVASIERGQVRDAIQQLPVKSRQIILLREYEDSKSDQPASECAFTIRSAFRGC